MATYEVTKDTTGLTVGQHITDAELKENHAGLGGAERLLALGGLRKLSAAEAKEDADTVAGGAGEDARGTSKVVRTDLDTLSVKELRELAKEHGVADFGKLSKDELVEELKKAN